MHKINWKNIKLGKVCNIYQPKTISAKEMVLDGEYVVFGANGIIGRYNKYNHEEPQLLITCRGATCGSVNISHPRSWITGNAMVIRPKDDSLSLKYLEYIFRGGLDISKVITGTAQPQITRTNLEPIEISYPESLSEQHRIVKILDETFEKIEKAKENAAKNLQNSKELFDYYLNNIFTNNNSNEVKKLSEVAEYFNGLTYSPKNVSSEGIIVLRSSNVQNDELDFSDIVRVNLVVKDKIIVQDGDILMCSRNGSKRLVGKTATIKNLTEKMTFGTFMMVVRGKYNPYISWFFKSTYFRKQISGGENTMINQITRYMLDDVTLYFPSPKVQNEIIEKLSALSTETKKLEAIYKQKLADLEELKKSILKKAFNGEL